MAMDAFSASLMKDKREIVIAPTIYKFDTFGAFAEEFKLGERDVVLTNEFIYKPFMEELGLKSKFVFQEKFGAGEPSEEMIQVMYDAIPYDSYDRVIAVGGAQAVAALTYGAGFIPRVDKLVGPGNAFVAAAKRMAYGTLDIDMVAGPSEVLVIADGSAKPAYVAADLLSQAEHDRMAAAVLVTDSRPLAEAVAHELERQLAALPRAEIARASLEANGKLIVCRDLREGIAVANRIAPEHLELCVDNPFDYLGEIQNAGSVFLGRYNPEPMGDYFAGPNHTLPTMGTARFYSPLSVDDFVKKSQFSYYTRDALARDYRKVSLFARKEGLDAHARAVDIRFEGGEA